MADVLNFDKLVIDRPLDGWFEESGNNSDHKLLAVIDQISSLSISNSSESKDKTDAQGTLIKRYYTSKSVEVTGENAVFSLNLMSIQTGSPAKNGADVKKMPRILRVGKTADPFALPDAPIEGTMVVYGTSKNGAVDISLRYVQGETAGAGTYVIGTDSETGATTIQLPTDATDSVQIKYEYNVVEGKVAVRVDQDARTFPKECKATFRVLCSELCDTPTPRVLYIVFPKFQMSPDFDWDVSTDATQSFSATALKDYCEKDQLLYYVALAEDSDEYDAIWDKDQDFSA